MFPDYGQTRRDLGLNSMYPRGGAQCRSHKPKWTDGWMLPKVFNISLDSRLIIKTRGTCLILPCLFMEKCTFSSIRLSVFFLKRPQSGVRGVMVKDRRAEDHMRCVTRKQTLRSLSVSYQKKELFWYGTDFLEFESFDFLDHQSFFWYDNDKDLKLCFLVTDLI